MRWVIGLLAIPLAVFGCGEDDDDQGSRVPREASGGTLYSLSSARGSLEPVQGQKGRFILTLAEPSRVTAFSDRPARTTEMETIARFVKRWGAGGFKDDPPNAALVLDEEPLNADTTVFKLERPRLRERADTLSFHATRIEPPNRPVLPEHETDEPPTTFGASHLFIDAGHVNPPAPPIFTGTDPTSPGNNNRPKVRGNAVGTDVRIWTNSKCTGGWAAEGAASAFQKGITVPVPNNSTTTFSATSANQGGRSRCSVTRGGGGTITYQEVGP